MKGKVHISIVLVVAIMLVIAAGANAQGGNVTPILPGPETSLPDFIGMPAKPHPIANSGVPQNPFLAPNPFNSAHLDSWNSDVADVAGPLGRDPAVLSSTFAEARHQSDPGDLAPPWIFQCIPAYFDSRGRLLTVCFSSTEATVVLADPDTLQVLSHYQLELPSGAPYKGLGRQKIVSSMGSSYSYVNGRDQITVASGSRKIITLIEGGSEESPVLELPEGNTYDLSGVIPTVNRITGVMLDWQGRIWFTTAPALADNPAAGPTAGVLNPATYQPADPQSVKQLKLSSNETIVNTFAVTKDSAYILTSLKLYRLRAGSDDDPYVVWSEPYKTIGEVRLGQYELGSGTSPTILGEGKYVAITDNDTQLNVVVFRTDERLDPNENRKVCQVPVFDFPGGAAGASSNSLVGIRLSLIVSNNYDYWFDWESGQLLSPSAPGFERIDIDPNGKGCRKVWVNSEVASPWSPRLSTRTGLIYTIARETDENGINVYFWTALDFHTGKTVWQKMAGTGDRFDGFYPAIGIGPNGALYAGAYCGFLTIGDTR